MQICGGRAVLKNGWGMSVQQHTSGVQFNALYVYDTAGKPVWYVMPGGAWSNDFTTYTGLLYSPTGSPLNNFVSSQVVVGSSVGNLTITYEGINTARLNYTINGVAGTKSIQRQNFGSPEFRYTGIADFSGAPRYVYPRMVSDMWWGGTTQSGWGISVAQQYRTLFSVWYSYGADTKPTWFVMPGGAWNDNVYQGDLFTTSASGWLGIAFNPASLGVTRVGTLNLNFTNNNEGLMQYNLTTGSFAGTNQTKPIVRQAF